MAGNMEVYPFTLGNKHMGSFQHQISQGASMLLDILSWGTILARSFRNPFQMELTLQRTKVVQENKQDITNLNLFPFVEMTEPYNFFKIVINSSNKITSEDKLLWSGRQIRVA